jgi:protein TonB
MVVVAVLWVRNGAVELVPYRLPGTSVGLESLTYYSPGSAQMARRDIPAKTAKPKVSSAVHSAVAIAQPAAAAPSSEKGDGNAGQSGLGDGDITIALQKYFPYPNPSLAGLPRGASGDVILNAVIDEHGKIADLTLLQGLGEPIDDEVIQTVNQWVYTPAMKNGVPVASVQELHFHYERRG